MEVYPMKNASIQKVSFQCYRIHQRVLTVISYVYGIYMFGLVQSWYLLHLFVGFVQDYVIFYGNKITIFQINVSITLKMFHKPILIYRSVATMIFNILCLSWIIMYILGIWLSGSFEENFDQESLHVFVLVLTDTVFSASLLIMVIFNRCMKNHTEGFVLEEPTPSQLAVLSPHSQNVAYNSTCQEPDQLAPSAPPEEKYF